MVTALTINPLVSFLWIGLPENKGQVNRGQGKNFEGRIIRQVANIYGQVAVSLRSHGFGFDNL